MSEDLIKKLAALPVGSLESRAMARLLYENTADRIDLSKLTDEELDFEIGRYCLHLASRHGGAEGDVVLIEDVFRWFADPNECAKLWYELERMALGKTRPDHRSHCALVPCMCTGTGGSHRQIYPEAILSGVRVDAGEKKLVPIFKRSVRATPA